MKLLLKTILLNLFPIKLLTECATNTDELDSTVMKPPSYTYEFLIKSSKNIKSNVIPNWPTISLLL